MVGTAHPARDVRLDSRFRENDPPQVEWEIKGVEKETASETAYTMDAMSRNGMTCCIVITMTLVDSPACLAGYLELGRN